MVRIVFRNFGQSSRVKDYIQQKVAHVLEKFPEALGSSTTIIVARESSPVHLGPQQFHLKLISLVKGTKPVILEKSGPSAEQALALLADRLFEVMHRAIERKREKNRAQRRTWKTSRALGFDWKRAG